MIPCDFIMICYNSTQYDYYSLRKSLKRWALRRLIYKRIKIEKKYTYIHTHTHIHAYTIMHRCIFVDVVVIIIMYILYEVNCIRLFSALSWN